MNTVQHATVTIERTYPAARSQVFAAWADPKVKTRWFDEPEAQVDQALDGDFREGGRETGSGIYDGKRYTYEAVYSDIIEEQRIVSTYEMGVDGRPMSVSVATVELFDDGDGTRLIYTDQGAYFDDLDRPEWREQGFTGQLDRLGAELGRTAAG